jgi:alpha-beta hydrolase superfamily lysophospholipase
MVESFADYRDNLATFSKMVAGWQPGKPVFIVGHSLGGLIACDYLLEHQDEFKGAVISAPTIKVGESVTPTTILMAKIMAVVAPKMGVLGLDASTISTDPKVVSAYVNDPLVFHGKTPARLGSEMLKAMIHLKDNLAKISIPYIGVHGTDDRLAEPAGSQMLYDQCSSKDKTLKLYPAYAHEVFNEPGRAAVLKDVEDWLAAHF